MIAGPTGHLGEHMLLWVGIIVLGFLIGRHLPLWVAVVVPPLVVGLGTVAMISMPPTDDQGGLAVYVAILVALILAAAEATGRWVYKRRAQP